MFLEGATLIFALALGYCLFQYVNHLLSLRHYPRGPFPLPIIGNLNLLRGVLPFECFTKLSKEYGDVYSFSMGMRRIVVVNSIQATREALVTRGTDFVGRFNEAGGNARRNKGILGVDFTPEYRFNRKLGHKALKMYGDGFVSLEEKIRMEAVCLMESLKETEKPVNVRIVIGNAVLNVICSMLFGNRYSPTDADFLAVVEYTDILVSSARQTDISFALPWTRVIYKSANFKRLMKAVELRDNYIRKRLEEHEKRYNPDHVRDFCDFLLKTLEDEKDHWKEVGSDDNIRDHLEMILANMIAAGSETTVSVLSWAILYLLHWPHFQDELFDEIIQVLGTENYPEWKDRSRLPLCQAYIQESLRMATIVPMIPHKTIKASSIRGESIPKDTGVMFNIWAIHHDPREWKSPEVFNPRRWLDAEGKCTPGHSRSYFPFGGGRRNCLGESLAKEELFLFFTRLIRSFRIQPNMEGPLPGLKDGVFGVTFAPRPYTAKFVPRDV